MCSSILSITNIAMMEVKAIVIYSKTKANTTNQREKERDRDTELEREYRKAIPDKASIVRVEMIVRRSERNSRNTDKKASPSQLLTS